MKKLKRGLSLSFLSLVMNLRVESRRGEDKIRGGC
jgi:hypothetical protein